MQADNKSTRVPTSPRKPQRSLWGYMKKSTFKTKETSPARRWARQTSVDKNSRFFTKDASHKNRFESTVIDYLTEEKKSLADTIIHPKA